jgi:hypothetical protein
LISECASQIVLPRPGSGFVYSSEDAILPHFLG